MPDCWSLLEKTCSARPWCWELLPHVAALQGLDEAHGLPHTVRVLCNALYIAEAEDGADIDVVVAAALLHDLGRGVEDQLGLHHAAASASLAALLLRSAGFPEEKIGAVEKAVLEHSFSAGGKPSSIESCIVSDADKLDALGAVGFARMAIVTGLSGRGLLDMVAHFYEKLVKLPSLMCSSYAKRLAEERVERLARMVAELEEEALSYEDAVARLLDTILSRYGVRGPAEGQPLWRRQRSYSS